MDPTKSFLLRHQDSDGGDNETLLPVLYRIYKGSVQRQVPNFQALSSHAAFLILLDSESQVVGWIGSQCGEEDSNILQELGIEVMTRDYSHTNITSIPIVYENDDLSPLVESFLDILDIDSSLYYNKLSAAERRKPIENNSISIGLLIPPKNLKDSSLFELRETSFAHPDGNGTVPRIPFPPIEKTSIVYMSVGDQWDLWFSRNLPDDVVDASIKFVENLIETQITRTLNVQKQNNKTDQSISSLLLQYFVITNQGQERQCFRRALKIFTDFEPFEDLQTILNRRNEQKEQQLLQRQKKQTNKNANNKNDQKGNLESKDDEEKEDDLALRVTQDFTETNRGKLNNSPSFKLGKQSSTMRPQMSMRGGDMSHVVKSDFWTANNPNAPNHNAPLRSNSLNPLKSNSFNESSNALLFQPITMRPNDVYAITLELIELREQENVPLKDRRNLLQESCKNPDILLGWQVNIFLI